MSSLVLDLRSTEDTRDVIHRAVQALAEGRIVAFPTETVYVLAASGLHDAAVARLAQLTSATENSSLVPRLGLAVKSADDAVDYVPNLCSLGQRLARRCWPGPVSLLVEDHHPDSLLQQLAPAVREVVAPAANVGLRAPAHSALQDVLRLLAGPVVITDSPRRAEGEAVTAQEVVERFGADVPLVVDDGQTRFRQPSTVVHVHDNQYDVVRAGVFSEQALRRLSSMIVLFVCTGNTCRSPMAEGIFRHLVSEKLRCKPDEVEDRGVRIVSAGLAAMMGGPATREAVHVVGEWGVDLRNHESQPVTESLVRHADLILAMTRSHRSALLAEWPDAAERVRMLCKDGGDVPDPVGGTIEVYRQSAAQIRSQLEAWINEINIP